MEALRYATELWSGYAHLNGAISIAFGVLVASIGALWLQRRLKAARQRRERAERMEALHLPIYPEAQSRADEATGKHVCQSMQYREYVI